MKKKIKKIIIVVVIIVVVFVLFHNSFLIVRFYNSLFNKGGLNFDYDPISRSCYFNGKKVHYVSSECCDQLNYVYDEDGKVICAPDGGFSGDGDGSCPNYKEQCKY